MRIVLHTYANYDFTPLLIQYYMKQVLFLIIAGAMVSACQKSDLSQPQDQQQPPPPPPVRTVTDTLMVYAQQQTNGKTYIVSKSFNTGQTTTLSEGYAPFASNQRLVYVKGNSLGYGKLDGVAKVAATFT